MNWKTKTIGGDQLRAITSADRAETRAILFELGRYRRPRTRAECGTERPCPFVSCKHHLYLEVNPNTGSIKLNFPHIEPWDMKETCVLDIAERSSPGWVLQIGAWCPLDEIGRALALTRERVRQVEEGALAKLKAKNALAGHL